jgi:hypothetical protein
MDFNVLVEIYVVERERFNFVGRKEVKFVSGKAKSKVVIFSVELID